MAWNKKSGKSPSGTYYTRLGQRTPVSLEKGDKIEDTYEGGNPLGEGVQVVVTRKKPVEIPSYELTENDDEYKNRLARELAESAKFNAALIKRTNEAAKPFQAAFIAGASIPALVAAAPYVVPIMTNPTTRNLVMKLGVKASRQVSPTLTLLYTKEVPFTTWNLVKGLGLGAYNVNWMIPAAEVFLEDPLNPYNIGEAAATAAIGKGFSLIGKGFRKGYTAVKKVIPKIQLSAKN